MLKEVLTFPELRLTLTQSVSVGVNTEKCGVNTGMWGLHQHFCMTLKLELDFGVNTDIWC